MAQEIDQLSAGILELIVSIMSDSMVLEEDVSSLSASEVKELAQHLSQCSRSLLEKIDCSPMEVQRAFKLVNEGRKLRPSANVVQFKPSR